MIDVILIDEQFKNRHLTGKKNHDQVDLLTKWKEKGNGVRTEPCGTPQVIFLMNNIELLDCWYLKHRHLQHS